jgi:AraC-like DNA-binding protein
MLAQVFEVAYRDEGHVEPDLDLIIYDVIRALFRPEDSIGVSSHTGKHFERLQHIIERHFTDPDFGPAELALEAGVSPRYLQKLFASRGTTCNRYIESRRLQRSNCCNDGSNKTAAQASQKSRSLRATVTSVISIPDFGRGLAVRPAHSGGR